MNGLNSRERLLKMLNGEEIDRIPTFDIIHNIHLIEHLAGDRITRTNAEDLTCKAVGKVLDLVRHFTVPDNLETRIVKDENGFVYKYEWWTGHLIERPVFDSTKEIEDCVKRDMEVIYDAIGRRKLCHMARQHVRLFDENFDTVDEVRYEYDRILDKLDGTMMLPPEDVNAVAVAVERYDETGWWYFYNDYPETAGKYLDALTDYQMYFINRFADSGRVPFAQISVAVGTSSGLLYSPDFIRNEIIPREKKKVELWKSYGYHVMAFLDGYKWPVVDDFIKLGVDEIHPCEPYCNMNTRTFRETYPDMVIGQPIDCAQMLAYGTESDVREAVIDAIEGAGRKKIMIGSTSEIHPGVNIRNALAMYDTARNFKL